MMRLEASRALIEQRSLLTPSFTIIRSPTTAITVIPRDYGYSWEICRPRGFQGGTEGFFARYWDVGPEWLYAWTPDGWLGCEAMPGAPPESYRADSEALREVDPQWQDWLRRTREFQRPQSLHSLIDAYRAQELGSGEGSS